MEGRPSVVIACLSCSEAKSIRPPASGIHNCTPYCSNKGAITAY
jgi:hypothetical protein